MHIEDEGIVDRDVMDRGLERIQSLSEGGMRRRVELHRAPAGSERDHDVGGSPHVGIPPRRARCASATSD